MITLYSKPNCPQCDQAKLRLQNLDLDFVVIDISHDSQAREFLLTQGHRSVPQMYVGDQQLISGGWPSLSKLSAEEIAQLVRSATPTGNT